MSQQTQWTIGQLGWREQWLLAAGAGIAGFAANQFVFPLGWGLDILFGQVCVMVVIRLLGPFPAALAGGIAASATLPLWHHPWAMAIWTAEAVAVATAGRRRPAATADLIFWVLLGGPALLLSYGYIMDTAPLALALVVLKQVVNGLLCVVIAELGYGAAVPVLRRRFPAAPRTSFETLASASFLLAAILPTLIFARLSAPQQEASANRVAGARAAAAAQALQAILSRSDAERPGSLAGIGTRMPTLRERLRPQLFGWLVAVDSAGRTWPINFAGEPSLLDAARNAATGPGGNVLTSSAFGVPRMMSLSRSLYVETFRIEQLGPVRLVAMVGLEDEIDAIRMFQLRLLGLLFVILIVQVSVTTVFAAQIRRSVSRLVASAVALSAPEPASHPLQDKQDGEVFDELDEISRQIEIAGIRVADEQGRLRTSQRRLRSIARNAPVAIYSFDIDSQGAAHLVFASSGFSMLLGYDLEQPLDTIGWKSLIHPDDVQHVIMQRQKLAAGIRIASEYRMRHRSGHYIWVLDSMAVERDERSEGGLEAVGMLIDVTDRHLALERLRQAEKLAGIGRMAAGMAHELNQPLHIMKAALANLQQRLLLSRLPAAKLAEKLTLLGDQVHRASTIIEQLQGYDRSGDASLRSFRLDEVLARVGRGVQHRCKDECIDFEWESLDKPLIIKGSGAALEQALSNLIANGLDAVGAARRSGKFAGAVRVRVRPEGAWVSIVVEDDGPGIADGNIAKIFEPFFTTKPPREGTGLGLSVAYAIIKDLGGRIWAENTAHGAQFTVQLPTLDENAALAAHAGPSLH